MADPFRTIGIAVQPLKDIEAFIFDLDGVITRTARVHAQAWKAAFDPWLEARGAPVFNAEAEYRRYVDGRPREDGVRTFLAGRGLRASEAEVAALAQRKNALFLQALRGGRVQVFEESVAFIRRLRARGVRTAVVTASRNGLEVLRAAGVADLFDVTLDGNDAARLALAGKPAPETFLEAARALAVPPARAAVVEDAAAGVEAGRRGGFGAVIGVDRTASAALLRERGATLVVDDLARLEGLA